MSRLAICAALCIAVIGSVSHPSLAGPGGGKGWINRAIKQQKAAEAPPAVKPPPKQSTASAPKSDPAPKSRLASGGGGFDVRSTARGGGGFDEATLAVNLAIAPATAAAAVSASSMAATKPQ